MIELELIIKNIDFCSLYQKFTDNNIKFDVDHIEENYIFDLDKPVENDENTYARIRKTTDIYNNENYYMAIKTLLKNEGPYIKRDEVEIEISDYLSGIKIFEILNLKLNRVSKKHRIAFNVSKCNVSLNKIYEANEYTYLEIEGPNEAEINKVLNSLDLGDLLDI